MAGRRTRLSVLLADKSALEWARRDTRARAAFLSLRTAHVIAACHMTALEICYSARNSADLEALLTGQRALEWLPVTDAAMDRALEVQRLLATIYSAVRSRPPTDGAAEPRSLPTPRTWPSAVRPGIADAYPSTELLHRNSSLGFLQHPNNLLFTEPTLPHRCFSSPVCWPDLSY